MNIRSLLFLSFPLFACATTPPPADLVDTSESSSTETDPTPPPDTPTVTGDGTSGSLPEPTVATTETSTGTTMVAPETETTGTTASVTTDTAPKCGDGLLDRGEECDLHLDNSDKGYCKTDCTLAVCGDGALWHGVENCDEGPGGNTGIYGGCTPECQFAPYCGDGEPHPFEACDEGPMNGTGEHADGFVACSATCDLEASRIFITSRPYSGDLNGLTGADLLCQNLAKAAGWTNTKQLRAWLSNSDESPLTRFVGVDPDRPYALVNGKRAANSFTDLIASGPGDGITLDELGAVHSSVRVWTNTAVTGAVFSQSDHCANWVSDSNQFLGWTGINAVPKLPADEWQKWADQKQWTSRVFRSCDYQHHLYCLEI